MKGQLKKNKKAMVFFIGYFQALISEKAEVIIMIKSYILL